MSWQVVVLVLGIVYAALVFVLALIFLGGGDAEHRSYTSGRSITKSKAGLSEEEVAHRTRPHASAGSGE